MGQRIGIDVGGTNVKIALVSDEILLEKGDSVMSAIFFCVARKIFLPRHAVIFSMPRAWRGVKEI